MDLNGKIIQVLEKQTGEGKNGPWSKQEYVIETPGQYPKKVCFNLWGDKIAQFNLKVGEDVQVSFDVESREYNGKWYTDVKAWNIRKTGTGESPASDSGSAPAEDLDFNPFDEGGDPFAAENGNDGDDLPF